MYPSPFPDSESCPFFLYLAKNIFSMVLLWIINSFLIRTTGQVHAQLRKASCLGMIGSPYNIL